MLNKSKNIEKIKSILGLSISLAKANFKTRNEGSYLGILWYLLKPLSFFIILVFIKGAISKDSIQDYPIYLFIGLIILNFFNSVTSFSIDIIRSNSSFIKSLRINKEVFVLSGLIQFIFSHLFEFIILIIFAIFYKMNILFLLLYPFIFGLLCLFTIGISFILSVVGVYVNDLKNVWAIFTNLLLFATPIFYKVSSDSLIHKISMWNPLYHFINITRDIVIFNKLPKISTILLALFFSIIIFLLGLLIFEKNKNKLAEKI
jgi:ABC-2 type transport system permease protein